jgi:hypothetical protein
MRSGRASTIGLPRAQKWFQLYDDFGEVAGAPLSTFFASLKYVCVLACMIGLWQTDM